MKKKISIFLVVVMTLILMLTGCGDKDQATTTDKTIRVGGTGAVTDCLDPAKDWCGWYTVEYGVGETLFRLDTQLNPEPWLAESYENVDELTWKIQLKENLTFSNGEAVTPEKVIESLKRTGEMNVRANALKEAEYSVDGNAVVAKTKEPYVTFINDLCDPYAVIIDVKGSDDVENKPVGTGPFVIESFEPSVKAAMVKNPNYWGGEVKSEKIEYITVSDFNTLAMSIQNGEIDVATAMSPESADSLLNTEGISVTSTIQPRTYQVYFNLEKLTDKSVREAIMYGIDKDLICTEQLKGAVIPANGAFLDDSDYSAKDLMAKTKDPEKAKAILKEAGYEDKDGDGILEKDGKPLTIKLSIYKRLAMESLGTELQAELKKVGVDLQIDLNEKSTYFEGGNFEMGMYSIITTPVGDPYAFLRDCLGSKGVANYGKYSNKNVDKMLKSLSMEFDKAKRVELVKNIQQEVINDAAFDYIGFNNMRVAVRDNIKGFVTSANDYYQITKDTVKE